MKPVDQTIFALPLGNCLQAAIASVLELPLEAVPNFNEAGDEWYPRLYDWCADHGFGVIEYDVKNDAQIVAPSAGYWIAGGLGARGILHAVVYENDRLAHDPHPSRSGIEEVQFMMFFVALNPAVLYHEKTA